MLDIVEICIYTRTHHHDECDEIKLSRHLLKNVLLISSRGGLSCSSNELTENFHFFLQIHRMKKHADEAQHQILPCLTKNPSHQRLASQFSSRNGK